MPSHLHIWRRAAVGALLLSLLTAGPAMAHPFVRGGEAPVDSVATLSLAMAHGCGTEDSGGGDPTVEIALEVPEQMRVVAVADDPAYDHAYELDDDGRITVITWSATEGGEPAPDVDVDVVLTGDVGDEVYLRVFQGCSDFAYRWIGTPEEPADDPAVRVTLVEADPDAPAPAADVPTPAETEAATAAGEPVEPDRPDEPGDAAVSGGADGTEEEAGPEEPSATEEEAGVGEDAADASGDRAPGTDHGTEEERAAADDPAAGGGGVPTLLLMAIALVFAVTGLLTARRIRGTAASTGAAGTDRTATGSGGPDAAA